MSFDDSFGNDITGGAGAVIEDEFVLFVEPPEPPQYPTDDFETLKAALETDEPNLNLFNAVQSVLQRPPPSLGMSEIELRAAFDERSPELQALMPWEFIKDVAARANERHEYLVKALAKLQKELFGD